MDASTWQRAKEWLVEAAELPDSERGAFLAARCPDEALRRELLEMLVSDATLSGILGVSTLPSGTRLGPYEIDTVIGAGGMGEVYRARDTRLGRDVAIKVIPAAFATDRDRLARFEREAKLLAALNHAHICTLFDVGREHGTDFIVMEYVEGELLSDRLRKGPLPAQKALEYAIEIADALDKAHAAGIIHRDLKPGNVMLTPSGTKLLDFGLARSTEAAADVTKAGTVLGTLRYMSPEQLKGSAADARSDVWAFGCVLHQMLTGHAPFDTGSEAAIAAAILDAEAPRLATLANGVPPPLQRLVDRCLAKSPDDRWYSLADLRHELQWIAAPARTADSSGGPAVSRGREWVAWVGAATTAVLAVAVAGFAIWYTHRAAPPVLRHLAIDMPDAVERGGSFAISPDGLRLAFVGYPRDRTAPPLIWVRPLVGDAEPQPLSATAGSRLPFWSSDGRRIGFFADGRLKKVDVSSGVVTDVAAAPDARGGTWAGHTILFVPDQHAGLSRVTDDGNGQATAVTTPQGDELHRFPSFLADGVHYIFTVVANGVVSFRIGSLDGGDVREIHRHGSEGIGRGLTQAHVAHGMVVFALKATVVAQALDEKTWRLSDEQMVVAKNVDGDAFGSQAFAASESTVIYRTSTARIPSQLTWLSRHGTGATSIWDAGVFQSVQLSPDDSQAIVSRSDGSKLVLWAVRFGPGKTAPQQLTEGSASRLLWARGRDRVLFRKPGGVWHDNIYSIAVDGTGTEELFTNQPDGTKEPIGWSDAGSLLYGLSGKWFDLWELPASGTPRRLFEGNANVGYANADVTRAGDLIAYGFNGLYIRPVRGGTPVRVASGSVACPRWRADGRELYFAAGGHLMAVDVAPGDPVTVGEPHALFEFHGFAFSPSRDGERFLALVPQVWGEPPVGVVLNWASPHDK